MQAKLINAEVLIADESIIKVAQHDIEQMKASAEQNERRRIRLCAHTSIDDRLHEMLIVHARGTYIQPHKHLNKVESVHIIEGIADVVIFDENGNVEDVIQMGDYASGKQFYYRMSIPHYHTLLIHTKTLVFHEVTNGPFNRSDTIFASWAPQQSDDVASQAYLEQLAGVVESFSQFHSHA